jgi:hypothetical protein
MNDRSLKSLTKLLTMPANNDRMTVYSTLFLCIEKRALTILLALTTASDNFGLYLQVD